MSKLMENITGRDTVYVTNSSILENPQFDRAGGCCYGYCDNVCDWWIMIGCCNCPITALHNNWLKIKQLIKFVEIVML